MVSSQKFIATLPKSTVIENSYEAHLFVEAIAQCLYHDRMLMLALVQQCLIDLP